MAKGDTPLHPKHGVNPTIPICFYCGKEKNEVALLGNHFKGEAPKNMCIDRVPCDTCVEHMKMGIMIIECIDGTDQKNPYRTGRIWVIKEEAMQKMVESFDTAKNRVAFIEKGACEKMGLHQA